MEFNRQTQIEFPNNPEYGVITTGIASGSLLIDRLLVENNIEFGRALSNRFEVDLYNVADISGEKIVVSQIIDDTTVKKLFTGYVESAKLDNSGYNRNIVAYDIIKLKGKDNVADWWDLFWSDRETATLRELRLNLCEYEGIECSQDTLLNDDFEVTKDIDISSISFGDMLYYICQLSMVIPDVDENGILQFITLSTDFDSAYDIAGKYEGENSYFEDYLVNKIDRLQITDMAGNVVTIKGTGNNAYTFDKNFLLFNRTVEQLNTLATSLFNAIKDIEYTPAQIKMIVSDLDIPIGSLVQTDKGYTYVLQNTLSGILLVEQDLISYGDENRDEVTTDFDPTYEILNGRFSKFEKDLDGVRIDVGQIKTDLDTNYLDKEETEAMIEASAGEVAIEVTKQVSKNLSVGAKNLLNDSEFAFCLVRVEYKVALTDENNETLSDELDDILYE